MNILFEKKSGPAAKRDKILIKGSTNVLHFFAERRLIRALLLPPRSSSSIVLVMLLLKLTVFERAALHLTLFPSQSLYNQVPCTLFFSLSRCFSFHFLKLTLFACLGRHPDAVHIGCRCSRIQPSFQYSNR